MKKFVLTSLSIFVFSACGGQVAEEPKYPLQIVTTVGMVADIVTNVGGEWLEVQSLMGPGVDPHLYKASAGDISKMENADMVFYVGLELEGKMEDILEQFSEKGRGYAISKSISEEKLLPAQEGMSGTYDPHVWFDTALWAETVVSVEKTLSEIDPDHAAVYAANAAAYKKMLVELDQWVRDEVATIPQEQRVMITAHDAFNYFGKAYEVDVRGVQGISTASDYGLKDLEELINLIVEKKIKAIFVETSVSGKSIEALQEGVKAKGHDVKIGGTLFSDAMGDPGTDAGTYAGMVRSNVTTIVNALK